MPQRFLLPPNATARTKEIPLQDALRLYADAYIEDALVSEQDASVRPGDLLSGFHAYLLNRNIHLSRSAVVGTLFAALEARSGLPVRGRSVPGWRFRTPADPR